MTLPTQSSIDDSLSSDNIRTKLLALGGIQPGASVQWIISPTESTEARKELDRAKPANPNIEPLYRKSHDAVLSQLKSDGLEVVSIEFPDIIARLTYDQARTYAGRDYVQVVMQDTIAQPRSQ